MYISGGSNVYPKEIEEILLQDPAIAEACVVGIPDDKWGEIGIAILVPREGATPDEPALRTRLADQLARYKHPHRFVLWPELPKSGYGKVAKAEVKKLLEAQDASQAA
jgi:acyl-CoA synthetase (AMP-forming)/AMP-acid ligase II